METRINNQHENSSHKDRLYPLDPGPEKMVNKDEQADARENPERTDNEIIEPVPGDITAGTETTITDIQENKNKSKEDKARTDGPYGIHEPGYNDNEENFN